MWEIGSYMPHTGTIALNLEGTADSDDHFDTTVHAELSPQEAIALATELLEEAAKHEPKDAAA